MDTKILALVAAVALILVSSVFGFSLPREAVEVAEELTGINLNEGSEIIRNRSYQICHNLRWEEIQAAGMKTTELSWNGFLQVCERLIFDLGNLQVYIDLEARIMFVYDPSEADSEAYYVQFT